MKFKLTHKGKSMEIDVTDKVKICVGDTERWIEASAIMIAPSLVDTIEQLRKEVSNTEAGFKDQIDQANDDAEIMAMLIKCIFSKSAFEKLKNGYMKLSYYGHPNHDEIELAYNQMIKIERLKTLRQL